MMSGVEPAPNGTMKRTVLVGQSCAARGARRMSACQQRQRENASHPDPPNVAAPCRPAAFCAICRAGRCRRSSELCFHMRQSGVLARSCTNGPRAPDPRAGGVHRHPRVRHDAARARARPDRAGSARGPTRASISLASILGVVLIGYGFGPYRAAGYIALWNPPAWTRHVTVAAGVAGDHLLLRGLFARPHQDRR